MPHFAIALVHHPVVDRAGAVITTAVTNLDLHDLARSACTYGASDVFIVHPIAAQRALVERVRDHWVGGSGAQRIPSREPALRLLRIVSALDDVYAGLGGRSRVDVYVTTARSTDPRAMRFADARQRIESTDRSSLLLFGTGWGLAPAVLASADVLLEPIAGRNPTGYNHLSVRAACAICLDRLLSSIGSQ